jgi:Tfp pilus assembly protein PilO
MGTAKKSTWIGGTAFLAVVMMALAWFLLISPVLATADDTKAQTKSTEEQNAILQQKVDELKAEFEHIDEYKDELAAIATQITPTLDLAPYIESVDKVAEDSEVTIISVEPQAPYGVTVAEGSQAAVQTATGEVSTEAPAPAPSPSASAGTGGAAAAEAPTTTAAPAGMTAVPVRITTVGTYQDSMTFLDKIQNQDRLFLVTVLDGTLQEDSAESGGRPETELGDLELVIEGFMYVLPSLAESIADEGDEADEKPQELPHNQSRNPLEPIEGDASSSSSDDD